MTRPWARELSDSPPILARLEGRLREAILRLEDRGETARADALNRYCFEIEEARYALLAEAEG